MHFNPPATTTTASPLPLYGTKCLHTTAPCAGGVHQPHDDGGSVDLLECGIVETA